MSTVPLVAHVIYRLDFGGLENGIVNLINHMPADRYRHAIICLAGYSDFRKRILRDDVEVLSLDKRPGKDPACYLRLWRELRRLRPAIVHTRNLGTVDQQWIARLANVRGRVHGEHGWEASDVAGRNPKHLRIRRACLPVIQRHVAVSRDIATWLETRVGVPAARICQISNGVDHTQFALDGPQLGDFPWGPEVLVIGTVGRLDMIKNQQQLIVAFSRLVAQSGPYADHLRLLIAGDGPMRETLVDTVSRLGLQDRIWLPGARNDVAALMRAMDIFVLPSLNEGISNTILEAMAMGRPVVAAAVGGNSELIVNGVTGILYEGEAADLLPALLGSLLEDAPLRQAMGQAGRARIQQYFGLQSMVASYASLYDELLCVA